MRALSGIRILELSEGWTAATLAGRLLAELGAEVVKLEPPAGDALRHQGPLSPGGTSYAFALAAAGKRSVVVPHAEQVAALATLAPRSDVLLAEAEAWHALERHGLRQEALLHRCPQLVLCLISPFGLQDPAQPWSELVLQACSGLMATTGFPDDPPVRAGVPTVTHGTAVFAVIAVLAALAERQASGRGQVIDLAGYDVALSFLGTFLPHYFRRGTSPQRLGNRHPLVVPWDTYPTRDGWIILCSMGDSAWQRLLEVLGRRDLQAAERFATAEKRFAHTEEIDALIAAWTRQHRVAEAVEILNAAGIAAGPIMSVQQFLAQEYCRQRQLLVQVPQPSGEKLPTFGPLFKLSATPGLVERSAPTLGEDRLEAWLATAPAPLPPEGASGPGRPLAGVRVLEMGTYTAVPYGTRLLALLGAEVIKIEPRRGDPMRRLAIPLDDEHRDAYAFYLYNTDKKSVTLAPDTPRGQELLQALIKTAHVFVHNLWQDYMAQLGLDYATLRQVHPGLIYCAVSGFGPHGAWRQRRAFDTILQALSGIMDLTGFPHHPPVKVGISIVDLFGALLATAAILAALYHYRRSGAGQCIDVALGDVAAWLTGEVWPLVLAGNGVTRLGNRHWYGAPHNLYHTRDRDVVLTVTRESQWQALLRLMGRQDLCHEARFATAPGRVRAAAEIDRLVQAWLAGLSSTEALQGCRAAGIPAALVHDVGEAVEHPLTREREVIVVHQGYRLLGSPLHFSRARLTVERLAPARGQHNEEIYGQLLGLSPAALADLRAQGVI